MGIFILILLVGTIFFHNVPDVISESQIVLTRPEHFEDYGFKCFFRYLSSTPVDCAWKLAPTGADLPSYFPSRMRELNDTNLLYSDHQRLLPFLWTLRVIAPANFTKSVKFQAQVFYSFEGLFNTHMWYGPLKGDSWPFFPGQDQIELRWMNLTSEHRYISAGDMESDMVGFNIALTDFGVYKEFKITLDEEVDPLPEDVHLVINNAAEWVASGLKCGNDPSCRAQDALTAEDLPGKFSPEFKALLANETNMIYFSNSYDFDMEFLHEIADLYKADTIQFFVEFFPDPNDPTVDKENVICGRDIDYQWVNLFNVGEEVDIGWRRVHRKLPIAEVTRDYKLGFKLRNDFRAVYRKFEIILKVSQQRQMSM